MPTLRNFPHLLLRTAAAAALPLLAATPAGANAAASGPKPPAVSHGPARIGSPAPPVVGRRSTGIGSRRASAPDSECFERWPQGLNYFGIDAPVEGPKGADFDGDGRTDYVVVRPDDPSPGLLTWVIRYSSTGHTVHIPWGANNLSDWPILGDFDGDGRTDLAVIRNPDQYGLIWVIKYSSNGHIVRQPFGTIYDEIVSGDFDGDGRTDFAVVAQHNSSQLWWDVKRSSDGSTYSVPWGTASGYPSSDDLPMAGDFDGDGRTDYAIVRAPYRGTLTWWVKYSGSGQTVSMPWGEYGDVPVSGDFNGDGRTDYAVITHDDPHPNVSTWFVLYNGSGTTVVMPWGTNSDSPVVGDFDGDGRTDFATVRPDDPTTGLDTWPVKFSGSGHTSHQQAGADNLCDVPDGLDPRSDPPWPPQYGEEGGRRMS